MKELKFTKAVAAGNDFIILDYTASRKPQATSHKLQATNRLKELAKQLCQRKLSVGADGLLLIEPSKEADLKMCLFNPDGSEAEMCGNGARCVALWTSAKRKTPSAKLKIETKAGIIESEVNGDNVKIKLTDPKDLKLDIPIKINNRPLKVNFINTGVPHTVIFVEGLDKIDVVNLGSQIRYHQKFRPAGTNVDFIEVLSNNSIKIRTYERGVEDETLACGTGAVAAALITNYELRITNYKKINVHTKSGEVLRVYFERVGNNFRNVWLEGKANFVFKGWLRVR